MQPSEMSTDSLIFIYLHNEKQISALYGKQKDIREELDKRLEPMKDKIRRGEIKGIKAEELEGGNE